MRHPHLLISLVALSVTGCSSVYRIKAVVLAGRIAFIVDPQSRHQPSCVTDIDVIASGPARARPTGGDDVSRVEYGTFWHESVEDDCIDTFPIQYGQMLKGRARPFGSAVEVVAPKPLRIGVVYEVATISPGSAYGSGAFRILPDRTLVNVPPPPLAPPDVSDATASGSSG